MTETTTQDADETLITGPHLELPEQGGAMSNSTRTVAMNCPDVGTESARRATPKGARSDESRRER